MFAAEPTMTDTAKAEANLLNLLIVDDERAIRDGCREVAQAIGFSTFIADNADHAYRVLETTGVDVALVDLRLPGTGGLEVLREIKRRRPETVVVVITGYATVQSAVQAMKNGAYDYVTKPFNLEELRLLLERVVGHLQLTSENRILREQIKSKEGFGSIIGRSPEMEKLYRIISKAAHSSHPVLILGESGTGKELVARSIHYSGPHRDQPFVPVDCGSLVPSLIESELFGYVKGAFTGANKAKDGLLAVAEGGTVFLDEVGELPIDLQAKLLRALQEKEIRPVGGTKSIPINARILAATNRDLEQAVAQGNFRRDLYFRLNVLTLRIPPLVQPQAGRSAAGGALPGAHDAQHRRAAQPQRRCFEADARLRLAGQRTRIAEQPRKGLRPDHRGRRSMPAICLRRSRTGVRRQKRPPPPSTPRRLMASCRLRRWRSALFLARLSSCTATNWKPRACLASARLPFTAN